MVWAMSLVIQVRGTASRDSQPRGEAGGQRQPWFTGQSPRSCSEKKKTTLEGAGRLPGGSVFELGLTGWEEAGSECGTSVCCSPVHRSFVKALPRARPGAGAGDTV